MLKQNYFKGWYFKCGSGDNAIALIPAFHRHYGRQTASLQVVTKDAAFHVPLASLRYRENPLTVTAGSCVFSERGIKLRLQSDTLTLQGKLGFHGLTPLRYDIMGPFRWIPFLQCRHSVYSMRHQVDGHIFCNGQLFRFQGAPGYLEGDCGNSFPKRYFWTQCFFKNGSLMLSVADVPMSGFCFTGVIGALLIDKKEYRIATYLGARLVYAAGNTVIVRQGGYELTAVLLEKNAQPLHAPDNGKMNRIIHESAACKAYYRFSHNGKILCELINAQASFEFEFPEAR